MHAGRKQAKDRPGSGSTWGDENSSFEWEFESSAPGDAGTPPVAHPRGARRPGAALHRVPLSGRAPRPDRVPQEAATGVLHNEPRPVSPLAAKYGGADGARRAQPVLRLLDAALERWWRLGEVAPRSLLREGLLVLEAGHDLDEAQRTLLLRSALAHGAGQITALHYQTDMERVALVVQEAALTWEPPLSAAAVAWLAAQDRHSLHWTRPLAGELRTQLAVATGLQQARAEAVLIALEQAARDGEMVTSPPVEGSAARWAVPSRWVMGAALAVVLIGLIWWQATIHRPQGMVEVPPGSYVVRDPGVDGAERRVALDGFLIDRFEVTNREYRRCYARGSCPWPSSVHSATRSNYFLERAYAEYPMVNVSQAAAAAYCRWAGKRLATAEEWEVAAGYAPATNRQYRYPWGAQFEAQRANSAASDLRDTVAVNEYRPAGDSMLGASGMAGNVAEWTGTQVHQGERAGYVVKGGSFADAPAALTTAAQMVVPEADAQAWLGIRCVRTVLLDQR